MDKIAAPSEAPELLDVLPVLHETIYNEKTNRRYRLVAALDKGGFGVVFEATEDKKRLAIKTEKYSRSVLSNEATVLKLAAQHKCSRIVEFVDYGVVKPRFCFLAMSLLGPNLAYLRAKQDDQRFTLQTAVRLAILTLQAIQELHQKVKYISRDVKPGNFGIGVGEDDRRVFMFDFGIARKYVDERDNIIPARNNAGWRGTTRYGCLAAHMKRDLSRGSDVESWYYMIVEMIRSDLPWSLNTDREAVHKLKIRARNEGRSSFLEGCPEEYGEILTYIDSLKFNDVPSYEKIVALLEEIMKKHKITWCQQYDWEGEAKAISDTHSSSCRQEDVNEIVEDESN